MAKPIETDVLCIGAGVAGLSTALALVRRLKAGGSKELPRVLVLEKSRAVGNHVLSGAVMDPEGFRLLLTEDEFAKLPIESTVSKEAFALLSSAQRGIKLPLMAKFPVMKAEGFPLVSLTKVTRYLATLCEQEGIEIHTGFAAAELIEEDGLIVGARTGEKGLDKSGCPKANHLPPEEIRARVTVLAEGGYGILTERLIRGRKLRSTRPQTYALAFKELYEVPANNRAGEIVHTFGWPMPDLHTYGGGFVYHMNATTVAVGLAVGLDYTKPDFDPHAAFRRFKAHPFIRSHIESGKVVAYGAKVIPEGGLLSLPALSLNGALIVGDAAGLVDSLRIKGIHLAVESGIAAGETLADCWEHGQDFGEPALLAYRGKIRLMPGWRQLERVQSVRAPFSRNLLLGMAAAGCAVFKIPFLRFKVEDDADATRPLAKDSAGKQPSLRTSEYSKDRLGDLFLSGTVHDEDQPCHLKIKDEAKCAECLTRFGAPCLKFCPAEVYRLEDGKIKVDFSNCLHCKTCQIKDPLHNIEWCFPTGGEGPRYTRM
ncbi:MAG: electron-transfer flavoprotein:ubiquinone oxidoreductase [Kiritimatiellia bacterium]|nr:electron-transfer flavoprotein:ubiquinone oxidoreductase [Kiritimatiellia bacterium]